MLLLERHWWLRLVGALLTAATALLFGLWYFAHVLPRDLNGGMPAIWDVLLAFDIVAVLLGIALHAVIKAVLTRRRAERLRSAIDGYQDALPLARVAVERGGPSEDLDRVVASWPHPRWAVVVVLVGFLFVAAGIFSFGAPLALSILVILHAPIPAWLIAFIRWSGSSSAHKGTAPMPNVPAATALLATILLFGSSTLLCLWALPGILTSIIFQPSRIEVDSEGITWHSVWGMRRLIRWHDVRLLEVTSNSVTQGQSTRMYWLWTLYGRHSSIRWQQRADVPRPFSDPFARVTHSVIAHISLQPRTFDASLLTPGEAPPTTFLDRMSAHFMQRLGIGVLVVTTLAIGLVQPILLGSGVVLLATGAALSLIGKWSERKRQTTIRGLPFSLDQEAGTPPAFSPQAVYEMTVGSILYFRFSQITFAIIGAGAALFGLGMLSLEVAEYVLYIPGLHVSPLSANGIAALVCFIIGGILTIIVVVRAKDTIMLADDHGVRKRWLMGNAFIPWDQVESIKLRYVYGSPLWYRVNGGQRKLHVSWPVSPFHPSRTPQERGAILLTPEQMAALVAQRSGKPIQSSGRM